MDRKMYDYLKFMNESSNWWYRGRRSVLDALMRYFLPKDKKLDILDIACGMGSVLYFLSKYGRVFGVDPDVKAVEYSKSKSFNPSLVTVGELPNNISFDILFDCVAALDVIEHVKDDVNALEFINQKLLKKGGFLFITVPAFQFLWSPHDEMNLHYRRYTKSELKIKLEKSGFRILKISYYNTLLFPLIAAVKLLSHFRISKAPKAHTERPMNPIMNALLFSIFNLESYFIRMANFPFGISLVVVAQKQ